MNTPLRLLLVDDDEQKRFLLGRFLRRRYAEAEIFECEHGLAAIEEMKRAPVAAVITDHSMQPVNGLELTRWVRTHAPATPVVMVTGNPYLEPTGLAAGATLVVNFSRYAEIGEIVAGAIASGASKLP